MEDFGWLASSKERLFKIMQFKFIPNDVLQHLMSGK